MCLIAFNWYQHPKYKLILVANRDEYYDRPTTSLHQWESGIIAGRDLKAGGTWMGFHPEGKFAALTNVRDMENDCKSALSRGDLVKDFLTGELDPYQYLKRVKKKQSEYNGFNIMVAEGAEMYVFSNYGQGITQVTPGLHGVSNALMDTPWPKVQTAKADLGGLLEKPSLAPDHLLDLLQSRTLAEMDQLPKTGLKPHLEQAVSAQFIAVEGYYGTVNTTAVLWQHDGKVFMTEKRTSPEPETTSIEFKVK